MSLSKKLQVWQNAKLIDIETATKILQFEQQNSRPIVLWALASMGAFAIILGVVSVVASNWLQTPNWLKLLADLILCFIIALALFRVVTNPTKNNLWLREVLVIIYYGFTLASMALIGQIYQLGGSIASLFLAWTLVTIPIVLLGRGKFLSILWMISTSVTYVLNIAVFNDFMQQFTSLGFVTDAVVGVFIVLSPFIFILISRIPWLLKNRQVMAKDISRYGWFLIILGGWFSHLLWYESIVSTLNIHRSLPLGLGIYLVATIIMVYFISKLYASEPRKTYQTYRVILIVVFILVASALWHQQSYPVVGAVINLLYMGVLAWAALNSQLIKLFNLMTALICLRLLIIYYEVFGSMFETGLGLVAGGVITLLVVWGWFKQSKAILDYFDLPRAQREAK